MRDVPHCAVRTRVDSDAQLNRLVGAVPDPEVLHRPHEVQGHRGDLAGVVVTVADGQAARHHVRVADRLNLVRPSVRLYIYKAPTSIEMSYGDRLKLCKLKVYYNTTLSELVKPVCQFPKMRL